MAEYKRDKRIFRAFHSTDDDAMDILMAMYDAAYPGMDEETRTGVKTGAQEAIDGAQTTNSWFLISPEGQIQLVPALAMVHAFEDADTDVWYDVQAERVQQIETHGYTPEHDDERGGDHLLRVAASYLGVSEEHDQLLTAQDIRRRAIKASATLVALIEFIDRSEASALVSKLAVEEEIEKLEKTEPFNSDPYSDPS